jgi:crotonobetainyl-CoA:carnitine CoA-transferase CaiB-like acyl-CoA transferase
MTTHLRFSYLQITQNVPAPLLGQHNRELGASVGFSDAQISAMETEGVLYAENT